MLAFLDSNVWGLLVVPVGLLLGFGPVIVAWLYEAYGRQERVNARDPSEAED